MDSNKIWMGFDIQSENGPILQPTRIEYWKPHQFKEATPDSPLHYKADALVGLSLIHLNQHLQNPFSSPKMNYPFAAECWLGLEPHHELFSRSQPRISSLRKYLKEEPPTVVSGFENSFTEILDSCLHEGGFNFQPLEDLISSIDHMENKLGRPLLYHFSLKFSKPVLQKLHYLHSLLFNLRALIAMDYNAYIQDATHEALKIDSITDYLSKGEYIANDALLYWNFKRQKEQLPVDSYSKMTHLFQQYLHHGSCLIESLPKSFVNSLNQEELEQTLYLVQMDWLLGTDAGLLFRLREEIFGLMEGYGRIFWPELQGKPEQKSWGLSVNCLLTRKDVFPSSEAA